MSRIALVRVTFGDEAEAERIVRAVVEEKLAACANLEACRSVFRWDGAVTAEAETVGLFKTSLAAAPRLARRLAALHSYDLAAIEWWPAEVDAAVAAWVAASVDP